MTILPRSLPAAARQLPRGLVRPAVRLLREAPVWVQTARVRRGRGPCAAFLPACGREGAAHLRIHNIADALRPLGWDCVVLTSTLTLAQRRRLLAAAAPDVVVMQGARHALNRPALYPGYRIVFDMDDADFHLPHLAGPVREAMAGVEMVIAGSRYVADWCRAAGARRSEVVWTGTPVSAALRPPQAGRPALVAWAQTRPATYRREAAQVLDVMTALRRRRPDVRLRLYDRRPGDEDGFLAPFQSAGLDVEWRESLRYRDYLASFDDVAVGLAPICPETPFSRGKSFGKVLAYLDRKVPVVASDAVEHGQFFTPETGRIGNDPGEWVDTLHRWLDSASDRQAVADAAFTRFQDRLSVEAAAARVNAALRSVVGAPADRIT